MEREKLLSIIKLAIENGITSKEIEPSRRGTTIGKILKGKSSIMNCTPKKIKEIESNTIELLNKKNIDYDGAAKESSNDDAIQKKENSNLAMINHKITLLEKQIYWIRDENKELRNILENLQSAINYNSQKISTENEPKASNVLGFTLQKRNNYWYAGKHINGKLQWIYIGKNKELAETKIKAWLEK